MKKEIEDLMIENSRFSDQKIQQSVSAFTSNTETNGTAEIMQTAEIFETVTTTTRKMSTHSVSI